MPRSEAVALTVPDGGKETWPQVTGRLGGANWRKSRMRTAELTVDSVRAEKTGLMETGSQVHAEVLGGSETSPGNWRDPPHSLAENFNAAAKAPRLRGKLGLKAGLGFFFFFRSDSKAAQHSDCGLGITGFFQSNF